jgi:3-deoxy-manno-octulosonate cytidylyltransferase (CMP-KDO synthetase)
LHARPEFVAAARVLGVIPARRGAERLPRKPLRQLAGRPLVEWVVENARRSGILDEVVVATEAAEVAAAAERAGVRAVLTAASHTSGTSRVAEVAALDEYQAFGVIVNVQGDEPFLPAEAIRGAVGEVERGADIGTAAAPLDAAAALSPSIVKVVVREDARALYFSRSVIPHQRDGGGGGGGGTTVRYWQHLGVYAFRPEALARWVRLSPTLPEQAERLEQLRPLGHGMTIGVARLERPALPGIDTEDDLQRAEAYLLARGEAGSA